MRASMLVLVAGCAGGTVRTDEPAPGPAPTPDVAVAPDAAPAPDVAPAPDAVAPAPEDATPPGCPDGVVELPMWQGEYPAPVIHVKTAIEVPSRVSPCAPEPTTTCRLEPGVYHPWGSGEAFVTVRGVDRHKTLREVVLDGPTGPVPVPAGSEVAVVGYSGEGFCLFRWEGKDVSGHCPGVMGEGLWEDLPDPEVPERQLVQPGCGSWVLVDDALFAHEAIVEGRILGFGEVGPSAP